MRAWRSLAATVKWSVAAGVTAVLIAVYAVAGMLWEPLLTADAHYQERYPCDDAVPWVWVVVFSFGAAAVLLLVGAVLLIVQRPNRHAGALLIAGLMLFGGTVLVGVAADPYIADPCPARPLR